mgnify:CR=1 FL=1
MNREELQEVVKQLEALEALAKLFNSLWFEQIRRDITDSKVQAYLMVFEDAFPNLNHVIEFARKSADVLTDGSPDREHWSRLQEEFESLRLLLGGEEQVADDRSDPLAQIPGPLGGNEISSRAKEALGAVDQGPLFVEADTAPASGAGVRQGDIDALFENGSDSVDGADEHDEQQMDDDDDRLGVAAMEEVELTAAEEGESSDDLMDLLGKEVEAEEEIELEDLTEEEVHDDGAETEDDELEALLEEESDADVSDGDDDFELLEEDDDEDEDADGLLEEDEDDSDLLEEEGADEGEDDSDQLEEDDADEDGSDEGESEDADEGAWISDEEMSALLEVDDGEEEESGDGKAAATGAEVEAESDDGESKSQDEIDALFG